MRRRIISAWLALCLLLGLLPTAAWAAAPTADGPAAPYERAEIPAGDDALAEVDMPDASAATPEDVPELDEAPTAEGHAVTSTSAEAADAAGEKTVIGFEPLDSACAGQTVPLGRDQAALVREGLLTLPAALTVWALIPGASEAGAVCRAVEAPVTWPEVIDGQTAGVFVLEPILPEGYVLGEGVGAPAIAVTVADMGLDGDRPAGESLRELLDVWFPGAGPDDIPAAALALDEDELLDMIADYEQVLAAAEAEGTDDTDAAFLAALRAGIDQALAALPTKAPIWLREPIMLMSLAPGAVDLDYLDGDGTAFIYHGFEETTSFSPDQSYAFLNSKFDGGDAVSALGSGAILTATTKANNSLKYMQKKFPGAEVAVYVDVVQKGRDFDNCVHGGLYKVPDTSPVEYRYFCWAGGAQDCGPYYAYTYQTATIQARNVSAQLKDVTKQGSNLSADYTITLTYDIGKTVTLDPSGYTVSADASTGVVKFKITDNDGNVINARFQGPLAIRYTDGGTPGVANLPGAQYERLADRVTLTADVPTRAGYAFTEWKDQSGGTYKSGAAIASLKTSLTLTAQWRDTQPPDFTYEPVEVKLGATQAEVADKVKPALTITDNEPVDQCTVTVTMEPDATSIAGERQVTVTVTDKAGNKTERKVTVIVTASALALTTPAFDGTAKTLTAQLASPGEDPITETGLVWGIMTAPTTALNNGKYKTPTPVTTAGGEIKTTPDITEGVNYYARAYAVAGGVTYYSGQMTFGVGAASYGTFNIANTGGSTFTVTRTGGTDGAQMVYFRTVNGSAVGGTHFTHQAGTLTFAPGETSKTITVAEKGVATAYNGQTATAYSNADRTYSVELYRVTGGGTLGTTTRASRTMTKDGSHTMDRNCYVAKKDTVYSSSSKIDDSHSGYKDIFTMQRNYIQTQYLTYLKATADCYEMHMHADVREDADGYEWMRFTSGGQEAIIEFEIDPSGKYTSWTNGWFPRMQGTTENVIYTRGFEGINPVESKMGLGPVYQLAISADPITVGIRATGSSTDKWELGTCEQESVYYDSKEPKLLAIAPMPDSTYKVGDQFVISLIFDEIVDSQNTGSANLEKIKVHTSWGDATFSGGADTNVLYFTGTVKAGASGNLSITSVDNIGLVKDMCGANGTASSAASGMNTGSSVDGNQPSITVTSKGVTDGVGTATVTVNDPKAYTTSLRYVWSDSAAMPATGWVDATATELAAGKGGGLTLSARQEPGSGDNGKWYLHVLASYEATGVSAYQSAAVDFGTKESPKNPTPPALSLAASADNTNWATSRNITVTAANGTTLDYHREGDAGWTTMAAAGGTATVTENGSYTFRLRRGDDMVTAVALVERIDGKAPAASAGALLEADSTLTPKAGVYTQIALPVTFADSESGVARVEYAWTNSAADTPGSWQTLSDIASGAATLTYTATESAETVKYLHIRVTDQVGHTASAVSPAGYTVIAQSALDGNAPRIALSAAPAPWIRDSVTLTWTVTNVAGRHFKVTLPGGVELEDTESGTVRVTENGPVTMRVVDLDYGGNSAATVDVNCIDITPPTVDVPAISDAWTNAEPAVTFTVNDAQSGVGKAYYKVVQDGHTVPTDGLTEFASTDYTVTLDAAATPAPGVYYVYYKFCDNSPSDWEATGQETNATEGFAGPFRIDRAAPVVTVAGVGDGWTSTAQSIGLAASDDPAGMAGLQFAVTTTNDSAPTELAPLTPTGGGVTVGVGADGVFYLYYRAVDNAGNVTTGWSGPIQVDKVTPTLTVSGGEIGDPLKTQQTLRVESAFGVSGGTVTVEKPDGSTETISGGAYTVTEAGTYTFTATSNAGLTQTRTVEIYAVRLDGNGAASPATQLVASGGKATEPTAPTLAGHSFVAWDGAGAKYDFANLVTGDLTLTARWTLDAPTVTLTANRASAAYNNGETVITLTAEVGHGAGDGVAYTYQWFKNGAPLAEADDSAYALDAVDDSGTYTVAVTAHCGHALTSETVTSNPVSAAVTIARPEIDPPAVDPLTYGDQLTDDRLVGGSATLNGEPVPGTFAWGLRGQYPAATEGTRYDVVFTPEDGADYLPVTFEVTVVVKKAPLTPSVAADRVPGGAYDGTLYRHASAEGEIVLAGAVFGQAPTAHAQVEFVTKDAGTDKPVNVTGITLDGDWGKNYELTATALTGTPTAADVTPIGLSIVWHFANAGDGATDADAGWDGIYYTGGNVTVTAQATGLVPGDECALTVGENGVQLNAGTYTAKVTDHSNKNYTLPETVTRVYTIRKVSLTPSVAADRVPGGVYDGTLFHHTSADGEIVLTGAVPGETPTAHGQVEFVTKDAGTDKPVNVTEITLDGDWGENYALTATELLAAPTAADVTPRVLTFTWHIAEGGTEAEDWDALYYTKGEYTVTATATNLVAGDACDLTVGENGAQTNAGTYTAKVTAISNPNYALPEIVTRAYTIRKVPLTPSVAADQVPGGVYDGTLYRHASADGEILLAGAVSGETPTAHGQVEFVTKDAGENKPVNVTGIALDGNWGDNYALTATELAAAPTAADVTPKVLTFDWHIAEGGGEAQDWNALYYTRGAYTVTATATNLVAGDVCALTVGENGAQTNAGTYTAKITEISDPNYALPDEITLEYTIHKAPVSFLVTDDAYTYDRAAHTAAVTLDEGLPHTQTVTASGGPVFTVAYAGAESQTDAGTYAIVATLTDPANFACADGGSVETVGALTIRKAPVTFTIDPEAKPAHDWAGEVNGDPNPEGYALAGDADGARWNDFALTMTYDSLAHRANVRQDGGLALDGLFAVSYRRVADAAGNAVAGEDTETFRDAGTYEIWVTLTDDPQNFMFAGEEPDARALCLGTVTVAPYGVRVTWQNLTFVYHGHRMHPTVRVENPFLADEQPDEAEKQGFLADPSTFHADLMAYAVTDSADVGDYLVTVTLYGREAGNYTVSDPTAAVVIQPAPVVFTVGNNEWLYLEGGQARNVTLAAAWGEVVNAPDTALGDDYPAPGTGIPLADLGVTAGDIQYRLADGTAVAAPAEIGTYQVWVRIPNPNYRHAGGADGGFQNVGVLRIAENDHPATYTATFDPGKDEERKPFPGVTVPAPLEGLIPTQEITLPPAPGNAPAGYVFAGWSRNGTLYQPNEAFYMPYAHVTFQAQWTREAFNIAGVVLDDAETPIPYVSVALMMGEYQMGLTTTDESGTFRFDGLIPNTYNLVFTWNGVVKTYMVEITDQNVEGGTYTLPGYRLNTVVEVAPGSGSVVVDLDPIITDEGAAELYDDDERTLVEENGGTVEFLMKVENAGAAEGMAEKLKEVPVAADNIGLVLDMSLTKTVTKVHADGTAAESTVTPIGDSKVLIANLIYLPAELQGKGGYVVYRFHDQDGDGVEEVQTIDANANEDGERVELVKDGAAILVYARYYSTYVLTWYQSADTARYSITATAGPGGQIDPSGGVRVRRRQDQTFAITPDPGYQVADVLVDGQSVGAVTAYTFESVTQAHTIAITFRALDEASPCPRDDTCPIAPFTDAAPTAWYHDGVHYCVERGLMVGTAPATFAPDLPTSRAMIAAILWRAAGSPAADGPLPYGDVAPDAWYTEAIRWATAAGVVKGYDTGDFGPGDPITREQLAAMLWRYARAGGWSVSAGEDADLSRYQDFDQAGEWAIPALRWAAGGGVIRGKGDALDPQGQATRAQAATMLQRFFAENESPETP